MRLSNTLSRSVEPVQPLEPGLVRMYSCGPTVYRHAHIGNLRTYLMADWIRRGLEAQGLRVVHVKNITDVGHMRQEMLERGEDKVIASALAEGKTPKQIADFYTEAFHRDEARLGILPATHFPRATDHVEEMLSITERLLEKGYAYEVQGNVYFSVSRFPDYGRLSGNTGADLLEGVRAEADPLKRDPRDFTLWKAAEPGRLLHWPSPWGDGFPGWHIECSAMSTKYLGERLDIHTGGVDNVFPHHEGERAQSEGAFGGPFVRTWVHGQHLLADGVKMSKSSANDYTLEDLESRGFDPLAYRYLCLTVRYRSRLNFTFSALRAAQRGLQRLRNRVWEWSAAAAEPGADDGHAADSEQWRQAFLERVNADLDMPGALTLTWAMTRSGLPDHAKLSLLLEFDGILGMGLAGSVESWSVPDGVREAMAARSELRARRDYAQADAVRRRIGEDGYVVEDAAGGARARPKSDLERRRERWPEVSSSREVASLLAEPDGPRFSVGIVACNYVSDVQRCIDSLLRLGDERSLEVVVVDNGSTDGAAEWLEAKAHEDSRVRVIHTDHVLGEAAAKNILLKQSRGEYVVLMDSSVEATGDFLSPLARALLDERVGAAGPWGLRTDDLRHFEEIDEGRADAIQAYCFAFRRSLIPEVELMRESFRFYRNLDLEYSFCFLDKGYSLMAVSSLPLLRHEHRAWASLSEDEREELSAVNFRPLPEAMGPPPGTAGLGGRRRRLLARPCARSHARPASPAQPPPCGAAVARRKWCTSRPATASTSTGAPPGRLAHAADHRARHSAGHYVAEVRQVRVHVQGESVSGYAAAYPHAHGGNLLVVDPHADQVGATPGRQPEVVERQDDHLFQGAHVGARAAQRANVHDGVSHNLAGAVVGDQASPVNVDDSNAKLRKRAVAGEHVVYDGAAAERVRVGVFEQQQRVRYLARAPAPRNVALRVPRLCVVHLSQPGVETGLHGRVACFHESAAPRSPNLPPRALDLTRLAGRSR